jgi:sugar/nucleoside kinase (ribokinase family)
LHYHALIGAGGIGTGLFFALNGNHTLGREESRAGRFLDHRDYAKLHIISHYVQTLLGPAFKTLPVGRVGSDDVGRRLMGEMAAAGLDMRHVRPIEGAQTMNCVCLLYPDGSGGNLTVVDSACKRVDAVAVREAEPDFAAFEGKGMALAAPEVPLEARAEVLELATRYGFFRAASFNTEEIALMRDSGLLGKVDLLAINRDEAAALAGLDLAYPLEGIVAAAVDTISRIQPKAQLLITAGANGSWAWEGGRLEHLPSHRVEALSAAGAGDAFFSGVLAGLAAGLPLHEAHHLGSLTGALSVTSPHTINPEVDRVSLASLATRVNATMPENMSRILGIGAA